MKYLIVLLLTHLTLAGCNNGGSGSKNGVPGTTEFSDHADPNSPASSSTTDETDIRIDGKTPKEFYGQFIYRCEGIESGKKTDCVISAAHNYVTDIFEDGKEVRVDIDIYLLADGTYRLFYKESKVVDQQAGMFIAPIVFSHRYSGNWSIGSNAKLYLAGIGSASALIYNDHPALNLVLDKNLNAAKLEKKSLALRRMWTNQTLESNY